MTFCKRADKQAHRNPDEIIEDGRKGSLDEDWIAPNIAFQPLVCMQDYQPNSNVSVVYYLLFVSNTFFNMTYDVHENFCQRLHYSVVRILAINTTSHKLGTS